MGVAETANREETPALPASDTEASAPGRTTAEASSPASGPSWFEEQAGTARAATRITERPSRITPPLLFGREHLSVKTRELRMPGAPGHHGCAGRTYRHPSPPLAPYSRARPVSAAGLLGAFCRASPWTNGLSPRIGAEDLIGLGCAGDTHHPFDEYACRQGLRVWYAPDRVLRSRGRVVF